MTDQKSNIITRFFRSKTDFYALLVEHAEITSSGITELKNWINSGSKDRCQKVRDLEHEADAKKLQIVESLTDTLVTPLDREDIFDLANRLDQVINSAKISVREIEALKFCVIDNNLDRMAQVLEDGSKLLLEATRALNNDLEKSADLAKQARKKEKEMENIYRESINDLMEETDLKHILRSREIYQTMLHTAQNIERAGETILHLLIKIR